MTVLLVIITFEPYFTGDPSLLRFYSENFDSLARAKTTHRLRVVISDFQSSPRFKEFLREYVAGARNVVLLDGRATASGWVALNVALRAFPDFDVAGYSASDLRARDPDYLDTLLAEFSDARTQLVFPTVTFDGMTAYGQTQSGPIERDSEILEFPAYCNMHFALFHHRMLQPFGLRYIDVFLGSHTESFLMHQLAATEGVAKLCYRVNLIHERAPGRHDRTSTANWKTGRLAKERRKFRRIRRRLPVYLAMGTGGSVRRWLRKRHGFVVHYGITSYLEDIMQNVVARRRFRRFAALPPSEKQRMVLNELYCEESRYDGVPYAVVGAFDRACGDSDDRSS